MKMMRPMFYAMLSFSMLAIASTQSGDWKTNNDTVDLVIAIHYDNGVTQPISRNAATSTVHFPALREMLKGLVGNLTLGAEKTRMGILDFGGDENPNWLVSLNHGINISNVTREVDLKLGRHYSSKGPHWKSLEAVVRKIRGVAFRDNTPERRHVPQLIVVLTEVDNGQLRDMEASKRLMTEKLRDVGDKQFHLVLIAGFSRGPSEPIKLASTAGIVGSTYNVSYSQQAPTRVGSEVGEAIGKSLKMCRFKQHDSKCYVKNRDECVLDRNFTLAYVPFMNGKAPNPNEWKQASTYCFKNASIPCQQDACRTTTTTSTSTTTTTKSTSKSTSKSTASTTSTASTASTASTVGSVGTASSISSTTDPNATEISDGISSISTTTTYGSMGNATSPSSPIASSTESEGKEETDEPDEVGDDFVWSDDPRYIAAKQRLIASAVAFVVVLVIVTPIVIYGAIEYRKYRAALAKLSGAAGSQVGDPWTLVSPPEFTLTPASQLYVGVKSGKKSSKSRKKPA